MVAAWGLGLGQLQGGLFSSLVRQVALEASSQRAQGLGFRV